MRLCDRRVKADAATMARALQGNWRTEHVFALSQALERYDFFTGQIRAAEERVTMGRATGLRTSLRAISPGERSTHRGSVPGIAAVSTQAGKAVSVLR